jgi:putative hydrolase of the HAD superfamily
MPRIETVVFDGDDTLWHNEDLFWSIEQRFRQMLETHMPAEAISDRLYATEMRNLRRLGYGAKSFVLSMIETAIEVTDKKITAAEVDVMIGFLREILARPLRLIDGAHTTLRALDVEHSLILLTKGDLFEQENKIASSGLSDLFDHISIVSEKDDRIYAKLLHSYATSPECLVMVGNSLRSDVLPVIACGAHAIHIPYHVTWRHESSVEDAAQSPLLRRANDILEVPAIIRQINGYMMHPTFRTGR